MIYTLLNKTGITSANWGGDPVVTYNRTGEALVETTVEGTATVTVQGRMDNTAAWISLNSATQTNTTVKASVEAFPQMRAVVTAVDPAETDSGEVSTTPATGSISISENPSGTIGRHHISILSSDATKHVITVTFSSTGPAESDVIYVVRDAGTDYDFEFDDESTPYDASLNFTNQPNAGDTVTIWDLDGRGRTFYFSALAGDNRDGTQTEVVIGGSNTATADNFVTAVLADWVDNKIQVSAERDSNNVVLTQAALFGDDVLSSSLATILADTNHSVPNDTRITGKQLTVNSNWANGTQIGKSEITGHSASQMPVSQSTASSAYTANAFYLALNNLIAKGLITSMDVAVSGNDVIMTAKNPGKQHTTAGDQTITFLEYVGNIAVAETVAGTDGTDPILLEINDLGDSPTASYLLIAREDGDEVETITANLATTIAARTWNGGTLTATSDYNNKSVTLVAAGASLSTYGNATILVTSDPEDIISVSGMSGGAAGVSVQCQIDVAQSK